MSPAEFRLRICFRKRDRLRFLSHLEVVHAIERGARRADLPYAVTQGFNPHMKMAFGPALPVGTASEREYADLWLTGYVPAEEALERLSQCMPVDLAPFEAVYVNDSLPSLTAACTIALYEVRVEGEGTVQEQLSAALEAVVRTGELAVRHKGKDKVFDLSSSLPKEPEVRSDGAGLVVDVMVRMGQHGSLRPEALVGAALTRTEAPEAPVTVTRIDTLIETEEGMARPV